MEGGGENSKKKHEGCSDRSVGKDLPCKLEDPSGFSVYSLLQSQTAGHRLEIVGASWLAILDKSVSFWFK